LKAFKNGFQEKLNSRRKPSVKFWFLTPTRNQVLRLSMLKTNFRKKKRRNNSRRRNTGCKQWQITNLGTASRKEHKY